MVTVSMIDADGKEATIEADRIELVRLVGKSADTWAINAVSKKGGIVCPLDRLEAVTIDRIPITVRIIEPPASRRRLNRRKRK